jgi:hypothetical protein
MYRYELGRPAEDRDAPWQQPTDLEMASRLSFLFWDSGPDDALLTAAEAGLLSAPATLESQAQRLIQDPRARRPLLRFYRELMGVGVGGFAPRDPERFPLYTAAVAEAASQAFEAFVVDATFKFNTQPLGNLTT